MVDPIQGYRAATKANSEMKTLTPHMMTGEFDFGVTTQFHMSEIKRGLTNPDKADVWFETFLLPPHPNTLGILDLGPKRS